MTIVKTLSNKLEDLQTCHDLIVRHGQALQRSLTELESLNASRPTETTSQIKAVNERATIFKITSNALINASTEFIELCQVIAPFTLKRKASVRRQELQLDQVVTQQKIRLRHPD